MITIKQISELTLKEYLELQEAFRKHLKESKNIKYYKERAKIFKHKDKNKQQPNLFMENYI